MYSIIVAVGFLAASVLVSGRVSPRRLPLQKRFNVLSDQYATEQEGSNYLLSNNLWGMYSGSGSQTTQATSLSGNVIGWETTYSWANNPTSVKSYANVGLETGLGVTLASIGSIPTSWSWSYSSASSDLIADVSYDLWLSTDSSCGQAVGCSTYEIMVWLSKRGSCQPAGSYSKTVSIDGVSYDLWTGTVQNWNIFSFVISTETTDFNADLKSFFNYLTSSEGVSSAQFLTGVQAGTEPFTGSAKLLTSAYSVSVVQGSSSR
ncbi:concanavalin A-like lectin/glucanase [Meredithblackwellia eburnea MCA 4105]